MSDLISRRAVLDRLGMLRRDYTLKAGYRDAMTDAIGEVRDALTIDAVPVVHGRWETREYTTEDDWDDWGVINHREEVCSECGKWQSERSKFCSHCGAMMDGDDENAHEV